MFHFTFKDYLFLIAVPILLFAVGGALMLNGNPARQDYVSYDTPPIVVSNTGGFECKGDVFYVDVPVSKFRFDYYESEEDKIETSCFWGTSVYNIGYITKASDSEVHNIDDALKESLALGDGIEYRKFQDGLEARGFVTEYGEYSLYRIIMDYPKVYLFAYYSSQPLSWDDPKFRAFVDSFRVIN